MAPLDWGLGHATRCIPILHYLMQKNCQIYIAVNARLKALLQPEFPQAQFIDMEGYNIRYSRKGRHFKSEIIFQVPALINAIRKENRWLKRNQAIYHWDAVISDNRYGLSLNGLPSVFITHQLSIRSGIHPFADGLIARLCYPFIRKFSQCWVPDNEGLPNLAGSLSHPDKRPENTLYIGPLSRLNPVVKTHDTDLLIILSGPEPQRTILENKLLDQLKTYYGKTVFVRGLPGTSSKPEAFNQVVFENHLTSGRLQQEMQNSSMIICRSGYSSVMDLVHLKKKAILVPTPGQTEQEYLAGHLMDQNFFYCVSQDNFLLGAVLEKTEKFPFRSPDLSFDSFKKTIDQFVNSL